LDFSLKIGYIGSFKFGFFTYIINHCNYNRIKILKISLSKLSRYRPKVAQRVGRDIALLFLDLGARRGWVVSTTARPLYPLERPGTHCTGGWVGLRAGLDVFKISLHNIKSSPENAEVMFAQTFVN
jgi:hypothetical protein